MKGRGSEGGAAPARAKGAAARMECGVEEDVFVTLPLAAQLAGIDGAELRRLIEAGEIGAVAGRDDDAHSHGEPAAASRRAAVRRERPEGGIAAMRRSAP